MTSKVPLSESMKTKQMLIEANPKLIGHRSKSTYSGRASLEQGLILVQKNYTKYYYFNYMLSHVIYTNQCKKSYQ